MADSDSGTDQQFNRKMVSADRNRHMPNVSAYDTRRGCLNFRVRGAWRLFPRVAVGACDEPTAAVGKSVLFLRSSLGETIFPQDRKLIHRLLPVLGRTAPIGCDVSQRQPNQFRRRIVSGEMPACLDDLAHARVDAVPSIHRPRMSRVPSGSTPRGGNSNASFLTRGPTRHGTRQA